MKPSSHGSWQAAAAIDRSIRSPLIDVDKDSERRLPRLMPWATQNYSRNEINTAAERLIAEGDQADDDVYDKVNNWRAIHAYPLQVMKMNLKKRASIVDNDAIIAQRTKRIPAIIAKLRAHRASGKPLKFTQMQDIGGCRGVLKNTDMVNQLVRVYEEATAKNPMRGCVFGRKTDYIVDPKPDGYRGIHLVYKYVSTSGKYSQYNDLKIEIQIRSKLQHAWATAVETVDFFTGQTLKSKGGEEDWKRFFVLASNEIARLERCPLVPGAPENKSQSRDELAKYSNHIAQLEGYKTIAQRILDSVQNNSNAETYLLRLDTKNRRIGVKIFTRERQEGAQQAYLDDEKKFNGDKHIHIVLVSVASVAALKKAYPNYFLDVSEFVNALKRFTPVQ